MREHKYKRDFKECRCTCSNRRTCTKLIKPLANITLMALVDGGRVCTTYYYKQRETNERETNTMCVHVHRIAPLCCATVTVSVFRRSHLVVCPWRVPHISHIHTHTVATGAATRDNARQVNARRRAMGMVALMLAISNACIIVCIMSHLNCDKVMSYPCI